MRGLDSARRVPAAWLGLALAILATAQVGHARTTEPGGPGEAGVVRPVEALNLPDAPALAQNAPPVSLLDLRDSGPRTGGAGRSAHAPVAATAAAASAASPAAATAPPDDHARRALARAGRAGAPSTAPPFLSF